jgi:hypothetical protein
MELEFAQRIFQKSSNIKFHENPPSCSRACEQTDGRTDRHEEDCRFSQFCEKQRTFSEIRVGA